MLAYNLIEVHSDYTANCLDEFVMRGKRTHVTPDICSPLRNNETNVLNYLISNEMFIFADEHIEIHSSPSILPHISCMQIYIYIYLKRKLKSNLVLKGVVILRRLKIKKK